MDYQEDEVKALLKRNFSLVGNIGYEPISLSVFCVAGDQLKTIWSNYLGNAFRGVTSTTFIFGDLDVNITPTSLVHDCGVEIITGKGTKDKSFTNSSNIYPAIGASEVRGLGSLNFSFKNILVAGFNNPNAIANAVVSFSFSGFLLNCN